MAESSSPERLRILVVSAQAEIQDLVETALATGPAQATVHWVAEPDLAVTRAQDVLPQIAIVDLLAQAPVALEIIRQFSARLPDVAVIALVPADDVAISRDAVLAGARAFLPAPLREDELKNTVRQIIGQVAPRRPAEASSAPAGRVVVFCGPKGGTGRTTLAVNIALAMQESLGQHLLLVDADYAAPAVDVVLNLRPDRTIKDLLPRLAQLDRETLTGILTPHPSGLRLLLAGGKGDRGIPSPLQVEMLIPVLRRLSPWVVVDLGLPIDEMAYAFLDAADAVVVSLNPERIGLRNGKLLLEKLQSRGYARGKIWLVLNRAGLPGGLTQAELEGRLGFPVRYLIPNDQAQATVAVNTGQPMVITQRRSPVARACRGLALSLIDRAPQGAAQAQPAATPTPSGVAPEPVAPSAASTTAPVMPGTPVAPARAMPAATPEILLAAAELEFPAEEAAAAEPTQPAALEPVAPARAEPAAAAEMLLAAAELEFPAEEAAAAEPTQPATLEPAAPARAKPAAAAEMLLAAAELEFPAEEAAAAEPTQPAALEPVAPARAEPSAPVSGQHDVQDLPIPAQTMWPVPAEAEVAATSGVEYAEAIEPPRGAPARGPTLLLDAAALVPTAAHDAEASRIQRTWRSAWAPVLKVAPLVLAIMLLGGLAGMGWPLLFGGVQGQPAARFVPPTPPASALQPVALAGPTAIARLAVAPVVTSADTKPVPEHTRSSPLAPSPAARATLTATSTPTRPPSATPPPAPSPAPVQPAARPPTLLAPVAGAGVRGVVEFRWQPTEALPSGAGYEVVWWTLDEDPATARGIAPPTAAAALSANMDVLYSRGQVSHDTIYWTVLVVQVTPYLRLTQPDRSSPQQLVYQAAGGG